MHLQELQKDVVAVGTEVWGERNMTSKEERLLRMAEEMLELLRAAGLTFTKLSALAANEWYDRKPGEVSQEVAGVQSTLLAFANANGIDAEAVTIKEIARVLNNKELCRAKHAAKPLFARAV